MTDTTPAPSLRAMALDDWLAQQEQRREQEEHLRKQQLEQRRSLLYTALQTVIGWRERWDFDGPDLPSTTIDSIRFWTIGEHLHAQLLCVRCDKPHSMGKRIRMLADVGELIESQAKITPGMICQTCEFDRQLSGCQEEEEELVFMEDGPAHAHRTVSA